MDRPPDTSKRLGLRSRAAAVAMVPLAGAGALVAFNAGGVAAGLAAIVAALLAVVLVARAEPLSADSQLLFELADGASLALPGLLTIYFAFNAGGFFPAAPALAAIALALLLILRITLSEAPFSGVGWPLAVASGGLALFACWTLLSATWSDSPARALIEFDRALMYLLALLVLGTVPRTSERLRWLLRGMALAVAVVGTCALITRLLPDVWHTPPNIANQRLSYPLTYWNALGILGSLGVVFCFHLANSLREPRLTQVLAAGMVPILATAVFFTFSRGAIAAGIVGIAVYVLLGRPRGLLWGTLAIVPPTVIAVVSAYDAQLLASTRLETSAAVAQGHDLALVVGLCALGAAGVRFVLGPLDERLLGLLNRTRLSRPVRTAAWAGSLVLVIGVALAVHLPTRVSDNYDRFVHTPQVKRSSDLRTRLTDLSNNGRIDPWNVAAKAFQRKAGTGTGAGTFALVWTQERPARMGTFVIQDAHSLYVEALSELGVPGGIFLLSALLAIAIALAPPLRGANRSLYAALFAGLLMWLLHAGVDWDWEMPAVSIWLFCLGGAGLAVHEREARRSSPSQSLRVTLAVAIGIGALAPAFVLVSQRQFDASADAFEHGNCNRAIDRAASSISTLEARPEPYEVIGLCQARERRPELAVQAIEQAVNRDRDNWKFRYDLALVRGAAGLSAGSAAQAALRLNRHDPVTRDLVERLRFRNRRGQMRLTTVLARRAGLATVR